MKNNYKLIIIIMFFVVVELILVVNGRNILNHFITLEIVFGEELDQDTVPLLDYHSLFQGFDDEKVVKGDVNGNIMSFPLDHIGSKSTIWFRVAPERKNDMFHISEIRLKFASFIMEKYNADALQNNFFELSNIEKYEKNGDYITFYPTAGAENPSIIFTLSFPSKGFLIIAIVLFLLWLAVSFVLFNKKEIANKYFRRFIFVSGITFTLVGGVLWVLKSYLVERYGDLPVFQLIFYHLNEPLTGANMGQFKDLYYKLAIVVLFLTVVIVIGNLFFAHFGRRLYFQVNLALGGIVLFAFAVSQLCISFDLIDYLQYGKEKTEVYDNYYADPKNIQMVFPKEKRNLIYIFVESMEVTFADNQNGGAEPENYIPELTELVKQGCDFSEGQQMNGAYVLNGNDFTTGAMVGQTAGIPLNGRIINNNNLNANTDDLYIRGAYSIGDILEDNGYNQWLMIGSEAEFGGRRVYFEQHGNYNIFDYNTALEEHMVPDGYKVWWGIEDEKLFGFARDKITELSKMEEPFNLTLLTADTHFTDGYVCELCGNEHAQQYSNVISCASRQVSDFVSWIQKQDFYDNTSIVICGDHLYMDSAYFNDLAIPNYQRKTYVNYINSAVKRKESGIREYSTLDLFPTTLASLGVTIEGDRLGLGTNLFSDKETLVEIMGYNNLNTELNKNSLFYLNKILLGQW